MGSLITALQNQNIAAANQETLGDIYAANPQNLGYTDNPFGYTAAPAVIQTAYPKYGYNATAPQVPQSYEDYDLTTLFSMLQSMQAPQQVQDMQAPQQPQPVQQPQSFTTPVPTVAPSQAPIQTVTPGGILAAAGKVQPGVQPVQPGLPPVPGAYTVPGAVTAPTAPSKEEQEAAQAAEDKRIRDMIAEDAKKRQRAALEQQYQRAFAGIVSGPPGSTLSNAEMIRLIENPELMIGDE